MGVEEGGGCSEGGEVETKVNFQRVHAMATAIFSENSLVYRVVHNCIQ